MRVTAKPVRRCAGCPLNLGDRCWRYVCPRAQWRGRTCPGRGNRELEAAYREWLERPTVKTPRQLRQDKQRRRRTAAKPARYAGPAARRTW